MIQNLLRLQLLRTGRVLRDGGWRLLLLAPFAFFVLAKALLQISSLHPALFQGLFIALILSLHVGRKDAQFLRLCGRTARLYVVLESLLWLMPFEVFFWIKYPATPDRLWLLPALLVVLSLYFIGPGRRFSFRRRFRFIQRVTNGVPVDLYEWKAVLRRYFGLFVILYGVTLAALPRFPVAGVACLVMALAFSGNLEWTAPPEMQRSGGKKGLIQKIRCNAVFFAALASPLILTQWFLYPRLEETLFLLFCFGVAQIACLYFLLLPLSAFPQPLSVGERVIAPILFCFVAPILPLSFYLLYQKYRKATWALQPYWS